MIKFELVKEDLIYSYEMDLILYRIIALRDFGDVKKGDLGGYVEFEKNLSHDGNCWVYDGSEVYGNAKITGNARIAQDSVICGDCKVGGNSTFENVFMQDGVIK